MRRCSPRAAAQRVPSSVSPVSGRAAAAVNYAMAQVGDSYVYGAAGPSAFDCSGLTMMSWAQAGVGLPHSSSAQYGSGPHVASNALQPGDLVFYYQPISHVGMYIGNGMIVHAANPSTGVVVVRRLLHAVLRRRSPWLTNTSQRPVAHVWWVAGLSLSLLLVVGLVAWVALDDDPYVAPTPTPEARTAAPALAGEALRALEEAVADRRPADAEELADPDDEQARDQLADLVENATAARVDDFTLRYVDELGAVGERRRSGRPRWTLPGRSAASTPLRPCPRSGSGSG